MDGGTSRQSTNCPIRSLWKNDALHIEASLAKRYGCLADRYGGGVFLRLDGGPYPGHGAGGVHGECGAAHRPGNAESGQVCLFFNLNTSMNEVLKTLALLPERSLITIAAKATRRRARASPSMFLRQRGPTQAVFCHTPQVLEHCGLCDLCGLP